MLRILFLRKCSCNFLPSVCLPPKNGTKTRQERTADKTLKDPPDDVWIHVRYFHCCFVDAAEPWITVSPYILNSQQRGTSSTSEWWSSAITLLGSSITESRSTHPLCTLTDGQANNHCTPILYRYVPIETCFVLYPCLQRDMPSNNFRKRSYLNRN